MTSASQPSEAGPPTFSGPSPQVPSVAEESKPEIPGYRIDSKLGEGGMGVVWRAHQARTNRFVALKVMKAHALGSPRARARFEREAELAARLEHPNIARVYNSGIHDGVCYYVMELIAGQPLDVYVRDHHLTHGQILELMHAACSAMQYAHQRGVIHRDLKPSNILVTEDGQPHVLDFGLAKDILEEGSEGLSMDGDTMGTLAYMSPEQAAGRLSDVGTRCDVYSLGVILYHLLTGALPYDIRGPHYEVLRNIVESEPARPSHRNRRIVRDLDAIVLKCLEKDPGKRYQSVSELAEDMRSWLTGMPVKARSASPWYVLGRLLARHRMAAAILGLLAIILTSTAFISTYSWYQMRGLNTRLQDSIKRREAEQGELLNILYQAALPLFLERWHNDEKLPLQVVAFFPAGSPERRAIQFLRDPRPLSQKQREIQAELAGPDRSFWYFLLGECQFKEGNPAEAIAAYERCREFAPHVEGPARWFLDRAEARLQELRRQKRPDKLQANPGRKRA